MRTRRRGTPCDAHRAPRYVRRASCTAASRVHSVCVGCGPWRSWGCGARAIACAALAIGKIPSVPRRSARAPPTQLTRCCCMVALCFRLARGPNEGHGRDSKISKSEQKLSSIRAIAIGPVYSCTSLSHRHEPKKGNAWQRCEREDPSCIPPITSAASELLASV